MHLVAAARLAQEGGHPAVAVLDRNLHGMPAHLVGLFHIHDRHVGGGRALVGARHIAARRAAGRQALLVQVRHDGLLGRDLAGAELHVAERILARADVAHIEPFAERHDAAPAAFKLGVDVVGQLLQREAGLRHVDLQRHAALGIGQARRGRNVPDLAAHHLDDEHRIGGT